MADGKVPQEEQAMAGRPRTMAKRVAQLYDAFSAITAELQKMMPQQYRQPTSDSLGRTWQQAVNSLAQCDDYFCDLSSMLDFKAEKAEQRASATTSVGPAIADSL